MQGTIGFIRIVAANGINNGNVLLVADVVVLIQPRVGNLWSGGNQPVKQCDVNGHKDRVAGDLRQHAVEIDIRADEKRVIAEGLTVNFQRFRQAFNLFIRGLFRRVAHQAGLEKQTQLFKVSDATRLGEKIFRHAGEFTDDGIG